ncbi:ATP-binding protein [Faecalicatena acetigenes]|uniref:ATP-binding protein n=1 Tax=Faecalicatena acetigenes TaxID=2981790 RepID=A0ABT2TB52_9FIRM|nr:MULTISPECIES: ATP-binding protein [Lachnospiraceae]MCU6747513.1 ATP-binding protein [Faecalicatena acetigenes]SCH93245.1 Type IV secretory pathway%2C VirB4 components [uncultured Clostridium sp.]
MQENFRIKYIDDNLLFTIDGEVWAYYRMRDYNYNFISDLEKNKIGISMRELVSQCGAEDMQLLQIAGEYSLHAIQERSKKEIRRHGMEEHAAFLIDAQTEKLSEQYGKTQVQNYYYIGFKLRLTDSGTGVKELLRDFKTAVNSFRKNVESEWMGEYVTLDEGMVQQYKAAERLLYSRILRKFIFYRIDSREFGYIIEHLNGKEGVPLEDYAYYLPEETDSEGKRNIKKYDLLKVSEVLIKEKSRSLILDREEGTKYEAVYCISRIIDELPAIGCELFYHQQFGLSFPVDTSLRVHVKSNMQALKDTRNKQKEMIDLVENAGKKGMEADEEVLEAFATAKELETELKRTKGNMYLISYLIRFTAESKDELEAKSSELRDFYDSYSIKISRAFMEQLNCHAEMIPGGVQAVKDYVQHVNLVFLGGLGFGATTKWGDEYGIYIGTNELINKPVYLRPWLAAQKVESKVTSSLACSFTGETGSGKSVASNLLLHYIAYFGGKILILDPKSERGAWKESFPEIADFIHVLTIENTAENIGILDPFLLLEDKDKGADLAKNILLYLTGTSLTDKNSIVLNEAVNDVKQTGSPCMLKVIECLREKGTDTAEELAAHIESFRDCSFASLIFSDGYTEKHFDIQNGINVVQIAGLTLPVKGKRKEEYTADEMLSTLCMLLISKFGYEFLISDRSIFKVFGLDEAWAICDSSLGETTINEAVRMGRSMNSGMYLMSQGIDDLGTENIRNNIGMKFVFRIKDRKEIKKALEYLGLDSENEDMYKIISGLEEGECLAVDIRGRICLLKIDLLFREFMEGLSTTPEFREKEEVYADS